MDNNTKTTYRPGMDVDLILSDMADGVMVVRKNGVIDYLNTRGAAILGIDDDAIGMTLVSLFIDEEENEPFVQNVLDAVYNKGTKQKQKVPFSHDGNKRILEMSTTYVTEENSLILVYTDVTERENLLKRRHDSTVFISTLFTLVCISVLLFELFELAIPGVISPEVYTIMVEVFAAIGVLIICRLNGYTIKDMNLNMNGFFKYLPAVLIAVVAAMAAMCGIKALLIAVGAPLFKAGDPFIDFSRWSLGCTLYPLTVLYQEIMSRSFAQVRLKDMFDGKYRTLLSVFISSLIFSVMHISYGFPMMMGAFFLLSIFGFLYEKLGNIWLMCIIHYCLGNFATLLAFM